MLKYWGGVVPEIAARHHVKKLTPLLDNAFKEAQLDPSQIDLISVTTHPGLLGPLLTGLNAAKTLALIYKKPIYAANHLFAHLEAIHLTESIPYPYMGLLVSGGHSAYFLVRNPVDMELIGTTLDDAAGEAFDKGGKLMGLPYPAGRFIDQAASLGDNSAYSFPMGLKDRKDADLSFSGLKNSIRVFLEKNPEIRAPLEGGTATEQFHNLCASYQQAIIDALNVKLKNALKIMKTKFNLDSLPIVVGGGVACNSGLRKTLSSSFKNVSFVKPSFCTDNGAMIANLGLRDFNNHFGYPECLDLDSRGRFLQKPTQK
jgi:N6-L-threonylcarbamoyladenine synthase